MRTMARRWKTVSKRVVVSPAVRYAGIVACAGSTRGMAILPGSWDTALCDRGSATSCVLMFGPVDALVAPAKRR